MLTHSGQVVTKDQNQINIVKWWWEVFFGQIGFKSSKETALFVDFCGCDLGLAWSIFGKHFNQSLAFLDEKPITGESNSPESGKAHSIRIDLHDLVSMVETNTICFCNIDFVSTL